MHMLQASGGIAMHFPSRTVDLQPLRITCMRTHRISHQTQFRKHLFSEWLWHIYMTGHQPVSFATGRVLLLWHPLGILVNASADQPIPWLGCGWVQPLRGDCGYNSAASNWRVCIPSSKVHIKTNAGSLAKNESTTLGETNSPVLWMAFYDLSVLKKSTMWSRHFQVVHNRGCALYRHCLGPIAIPSSDMCRWTFVAYHGNPSMGISIRIHELMAIPEYTNTVYGIESIFSLWYIYESLIWVFGGLWQLFLRNGVSDSNGATWLRLAGPLLCTFPSVAGEDYIFWVCLKDWK